MFVLLQHFFQGCFFIALVYIGGRTLYHKSIVAKGFQLVTQVIHIGQ